MRCSQSRALHKKHEIESELSLLQEVTFINLTNRLSNNKKQITVRRIF